MSFMSCSLDSEARPRGVPCAARVACCAGAPAREEAKSDVVVEIPRRQFFALFARAAHGAKNPKKCRGPCWPPAGVRPCASKERRGGVSDQRGAGVRHGIGHGRRGFRTWDAARRRLQGRSRELAAASRRGRRRVPESRRPGMSRDGRLSRAACGRCAHEIPGGEAFVARNGYGAARHVR